MTRNRIGKSPWRKQGSSRWLLPPYPGAPLPTTTRLQAMTAILECTSGGAWKLPPLGHGRVFPAKTKRAPGDFAANLTYSSSRGDFSLPSFNKGGLACSSRWWRPSGPSSSLHPRTEVEEELAMGSKLAQVAGPANELSG